MSEPNPYAALERVLTYTPKQMRNLLRIEVWCEQSKCTPIRVFAIRDGYLVQCRSDADVRDLQADHPNLKDWSRRRAFFLDAWLDPETSPDSRLQVVCDCAQTSPRLVDIAKLAELLPGPNDKTRRVGLASVQAPDE